MAYSYQIYKYNIFYYQICSEPFLACLNGGDLLQSLKIPGGHIPWNCDSDVVVIEKGIDLQKFY